MRKVQHNVRWEGWLSNAIEEWSRENGRKGFSDAVNYLLACELDRRGYKREVYEPGIYEKLKRERLLPHLPEHIRNEVIAQDLSYGQILEKYGLSLKPFMDKAEKHEAPRPELEEKPSLEKGA
jgi:hypothetical protein